MLPVTPGVSRAGLPPRPRRADTLYNPGAALQLCVYTSVYCTFIVKPSTSAEPRIMDGVSGAASVIAIIDISVKIISLCFQYSAAVKDAKKDIERLQKKVSDIKDVLEDVKKLLDGRDKTRLSTTHKLTGWLKECSLQLEELNSQLKPGKTRKAMSRFGVRSLQWPFTSEKVENLVASLERSEQKYNLALQVDQT